jgi:DNA-binding transcriptional ArsR family regulator
MFGKECKQQRREGEVARALNHPLRLRILELHKRERGRPLSVEVLTAALRMTRDYREVTAAEVRYHLARLQDAELLPGV